MQSLVKCVYFIDLQLRIELLTPWMMSWDILEVWGHWPILDILLEVIHSIRLLITKKINRDSPHVLWNIPCVFSTGKKSFELDFLHAYGEEFLVEKLIDIQLIVTPSIFFRINTYAAEVLYQKTLNCADLKKRFTLVIDLWCGCGELSMLAAKVNTRSGEETLSSNFDMGDE